MYIVNTHTMKQISLVLLAVLAACNANAVTSRHGRYNTYYLYTIRNTRTPTALEPTETALRTSDIAANVKTVILVHGQQESLTASSNQVVKDALLASEDVNVIVVDWSVYSSQSYANAVNAVPNVGAFLATFIQAAIAAEKVTLTRLHLVGFDLGAHVVGFTGRQLNGDVARITGLNPVGSQWGSNSQRLRYTDAKYVEVIHTDGGLLLSNGIGEAIGHVDFFVNGGNKQPGCLLSNWCSHNRAWELYAASLSNEHLIGNFCGSWLQVSLNTCRGFTLPVGNNELNKIGSGIYRINTRRTYPF